jgi:hypothetical protein
MADRWTWLDVAFTPDATGHDLRVRLRVGSSPDALVPIDIVTAACSALDPACVPASWDAAEPLRFAWVGVGGVGAARLANLGLIRSSYDPCGYPVPQLTADGSNDMLAVARSDAGVRCALTARYDASGARVGAHAWTSNDGAHWARGVDVGTNGELRDAVAIAWDPAASMFRGASIVTDQPGTAIAAIHALESSDCVRWTLRSDALAAAFPATRPGVIDYAIGPWGEGGATVHELSFQYGGGVLRLVSPDGAAPFEPPALGVMSVLPAEPELTASGSRAMRHVVHAGRDRVLVYGSGRDVRMLVEHTDSWALVPAALVGPSRRDGSFDAVGAWRGMLLLDDPPAMGEPWSGTLLYTGSGTSCVGCTVTGTAAVTIGARSAVTP